ncbi:ribonuclease H-like domain-containing protein [Lederbergia citrea]|uniref:ribonuclease H-like domain-containing protein n=1 Tax=Lederbergia citrea TaxID=2833581 RepID=UPI001BC97DB5|nr:ribonuclease H-like domain-containing protein [Lederbergia citrea]MBS4176603.1 ribonuclease H-like domain-containing protein [Lederbergia citrea]
MSLKNKLNRFKSHMIRDEQEVLKKQEPVGRFDDLELPFKEIWKEAGVAPYNLEEEYCLIREVRYPLDYQHGNYQFKDFYKALDAWENYSGSHPLSAKGMTASDLFFFDTETTGLYGGAGNSIFLLGHARIMEDEVVLRQHFLPEPGFEVPLYKSFLESVDYTTLVTYNGKAFDWPQVKTRHTLVRDHVPKLPAFGHFDLYHASRRMWKNRLESVKLSKVEESILGVSRVDDVPGYLAPMIYFDFVERKNPEAILKVLKHNEIDILSLITLYTHLTFQILRLDPQQTPSEKMLVGKWFDYIGEREVAASTFEVAAKEDDISAKYELAFYYKKAKKYDEAMKLWKEAAEKGDRATKKAANIELAKLMEHQFKDIEQAIQHTNEALTLSRNSSKAAASGKDDLFIRNASHRLNRLYGKLKRK